MVNGTMNFLPRHPIRLRTLAAVDDDAGPLIIKRTDDDFVASLLRELAIEGGVADVRKQAVEPEADRSLTLYQPVHRVFHLALFEAFCDDDLFRPRLDPTRIVGTGLVIRRIGSGAKGRETQQGWTSSDTAGLGWRVLDPLRELTQDPDPVFRRPVINSGHAELDRRIAERNGLPVPRTETVSPLFVAPADVCAAAGKTILYGLIPVTSSEYSREAPVPQSPDLDQLQTSLFPKFLKADEDIRLTIAARSLIFAEEGNSEDVAEFLQMTAYLHDFGAFDNTPAAQVLRRRLSAIDLFADDGARISADVLMQNTINEQIRRQEQAAAAVAGQQQFLLLLPFGESPKEYVWRIDATQRSKLLQDIVFLSQSRLAGITGGEGRFKAPGRFYRVSGFMRVNRDPLCPPELVWSEPSPRFRIAEWHTPGPDDTPVVQISLPDITDRAQLKRLKPNVSFQVPANLHNLLNSNDLEGLLDGDVESGNIALDWICSFNIPIITICAFLVLNIFLQLFHIVFWWLFYIRICIPIPKRE